MSPVFNTFKKTAREIAIAAALAGLCAPLQANIGPPVKVSLASADTARRGEPAIIYVVLQAAADVDHAEYNLTPPVGWQVIEGATQWAGPLKAGQRVEFQMKAIPLSDEPGELQASLRVPNQLEYKTSLNPDRMGGQFPEKAGVEEISTGKNTDRAAEEAIEARFEPGVPLPEPANATEPQIPGQPAKETVILEASRSTKGQRAAAVSINASGRFTYLDDNGVRRGLRNATVELWNENPAPSFGDERCAVGITDANGNFTLGANCGDFLDGPDLFVKLILNNSIVEVKPDSIFSGSYTARSATRLNSAGGNVAFGTLTVTGTANRGAMQAHNLVMRAHQFMATIGESMSKVTVNFPGQGTFYAPVFASISVASDRPFGEESSVFHEYGHHVLVTKAESPSPDYANGNCDEPDPGHCIFQPELGRISWTEGWPNYFGAVLHERHNVEDGYGSTTRQFETTPTLDFAANELDNIEGVIAAILWDLDDAANDDQNELGAGRRDNLNLSFNQIWNVIRNFDPSSDLFHNHPTSIHELWEGLREFETGSINRISEVYREHGIVKPQPDVRASVIENPPSQLPRGTVFTLSSTVRNDGNERVNSAFTTRFRLVNTVNNAVVTIGTRTIAANMAAGASSTAAVNVNVPATTPLGTYRLRACADSTSVVPESDETDNCIDSTGTTVVQ